LDDSQANVLGGYPEFGTGFSTACSGHLLHPGVEFGSIDLSWDLDPPSIFSVSSGSRLLRPAGVALDVGQFLELLPTMRAQKSIVLNI